MALSSPVPASQNRNRHAALLRAFSQVAAVLNIVVGCLVLAGWAFDSTMLKSVFPGMATMKANAALCFVFAGAALWLLQPMWQQRWVVRAAQGCALVVLIIGGLTLAQYLFGWNFGIDQLLFKDTATRDLVGVPGRMSLAGALNFVLLGTALVLLCRPQRAPWAQISALPALLIALLGLIGYVYWVNALSAMALFASMALHTTVLFALLSLGILGVQPEQGLMRIVVSNSLGGLLARRLLPAAVVLPLVLGGLRLQGQRLGLYDAALGFTFLVFETTLLFAVLVVWNASLLNRIEQGRQRAEAAVQASEISLRTQEASYRTLLEQASDGIFIANGQGRFVTVNSRACTMLGYSEQELLALEIADVMSPEELAANPLRLDEIRAGKTLLNERSMRHKSGALVPTEISAKMLDDGRLQAIVRNITERKRLEGQLLQAQKMESIGQLAGGIAHDFNNLLTAIGGYTDFVRDALPHDHPTYGDLNEIKRATQRATALTSQLLIFARKQVLEQRVLNLATLVERMDTLLRRLLGSDVTLIIRNAPEVRPVKADAGQIEQVIVNLAVNARDAMPMGGTLTIETANVILDDAYVASHVNAVAGPYVMLAVSDTGTGIAPEVQAHIFEPFFTTKAIGKGTGLGLATCYGIVKQHGGTIWLYSEVGHGTTFRIYLPQVDAPVDVTPPPEEVVLVGGQETILLVEDEPAVRSLAIRTLRAQGYRVLEAEDGQHALQVMQHYTEWPIDLLVTDVVMPQLGGKALMEQLRVSSPQLKVLLISGYTANTVLPIAPFTSDAMFLQKPFSPAALARKVRELLDN